MRGNCRLGGIKSVVLIAAAIVALPAFGFGVATAQRPAADDDSELFKPSRQVQDRGQEPVGTPTDRSSKGKPITIGRRLVGSPARGVFKTESIRESSAVLVAAAQAGQIGRASCRERV